MNEDMPALELPDIRCFDGKYQSSFYLARSGGADSAYEKLVAAARTFAAAGANGAYPAPNCSPVESQLIVLPDIATTAGSVRLCFEAKKVSPLAFKSCATWPLD